MKYSGRGGYKALKAFRKDSRKYFEKNEVNGKRETSEPIDNTESQEPSVAYKIVAIIIVLVFYYFLLR